MLIIPKRNQVYHYLNLNSSGGCPSEKDNYFNFVILIFIRMIFKRLLLLSGALIFALSTFAQISFNPVYSTIPYLTITPDSRGGAMGDLGVATSPDVNSQNWNPAKYAQIKEISGVTTSFTPWLRNLVNDINLAYLAGFYKFDDKQAISASLKYFSMGVISSIDENQMPQGDLNPNEFSIDVGYSRMLSGNFSGALSLKYIHSDINAGRSFQGQSYNPGNSFAADLGFYYQREMDIGSLPGEFAWGVSFLNLGTKISYSDDDEKYFIPATLRLGVRQTLALDEYNSISASIELSKLLVPTLPLYEDTVLVAGKPVPTSLPQSWIQSFYDAPGGFEEEMKEIMYSFGLEYWYREQFAIRGGYFLESEMKGNRKYFAVGIGLRLNVFFIDYSYLVSTTGRNNPLANTMRFTIGFLFNK